MNKSSSSGGLLNALPINVVFIFGGFIALQQYSYFLLFTLSYTYSPILGRLNFAYYSSSFSFSSSSISSSTSLIRASNSVVISVFSLKSIYSGSDISDSDPGSSTNYTPSSIPNFFWFIFDNSE